MVVQRRTKQDLAEENERLKARIAELEAPASREPMLGVYKAALEGVPFGVSISAPGGAILWVNRALADMLGRPRGQIIGTALFDYWYLGYSESEMDNLAMLWSQGLEKFRYERLLQRADGKPFWGDISTSIITDSITGERWMLRAVLDASERHQNEEDLRSQREHSHAVLESMSEAVCVFRGTQRLLVNTAFVEMMGHANNAEALASASLDFLPEEDRRRVERNESLPAGRRITESLVRRQDGREIHCAVSIARTLFDGLPASVAVLRDATARLRARQELEASERRYRGLFEAAPMGITILDEHAAIQDFNPAFAAMVGLPREEIELQDIRSFTKLPPGRKPARAMERLATGEIDIYDSERIWDAPNRDVEWIEFRNAAVRTPEGSFEFAFSLIRDITQRKHTERQRQRLYWKLAESKEEQSRELAKELHDEIGQQLTGLRLQLERNTPTAVAMALEITDELMERVRSLSLDLRPPSLDDLGLVAALRSLIERFTGHTGIVIELIHNQADFRLSPPVGIAAFRIVQEALTNVARHSGASTAMVTLLLEEGHLTARIEDSGCGTSRRLGTNPYDEESTGLSGMSERALALGGDLRFISAPGEGTVVEVVLPLNASVPAE